MVKIISDVVFTSLYFSCQIRVAYVFFIIRKLSYRVTEMHKILHFPFIDIAKAFDKLRGKDLFVILWSLGLFGEVSRIIDRTCHRYKTNWGAGKSKKWLKSRTRLFIRRIQSKQRIDPGQTRKPPGLKIDGHINKIKKGNCNSSKEGRKSKTKWLTRETWELSYRFCGMSRWFNV